MTFPKSQSKWWYHFRALTQFDFRTHFLNLSVILFLERSDLAKAEPIIYIILNILGAYNSTASQLL